MHGNKLKGTKIFKTFLGGQRFSCGEGVLPSSILQGHHYHNKIHVVFRLLYNFLILLFFQFENPPTGQHNL